jgi:hypothetical protein
MGADGLSELHATELQQLHRALESSVLHGSETLRKLLRYLVEQRLKNPGAAIKEQQIARELLGKGLDFDPKLDPTVRVQVGRLRAKLVEYYATEGAADDIIIDIPKGAYHATFRRKTAQTGPDTSSAATVAAPAVETVVAPARDPIWLRWPVVASAAILLVLGVASLVRLSPRQHPGDHSGASLRTFWKVFDAPNPPLVVFSNGPFVGNPVTGMRYFSPAQDAGKDVFDHYTGVGEVFAIHELDAAFFGMGRELLIKRARLLTWDEAKNRGIIFVGSPSENLNLKEVPYEQEFEFRTTDTPDKTQGIWNLHARPGESPVYLATGTAGITEDYSLVSLIAGFGETRPILLLAGTTTFGTQGAVEYVCREGNVSGLLSHFSNGKPVPFAAVIRVKVSGGVPVSSDLVTLHLLKPR